jgi:hypothetical protein
MTCNHTWVDTSQRNKPSWTCSKCKIDYNKREIKEPQRTWVGLTKEDIVNLLSTHHMYMDDFVKAVEAKLKQKNTETT